MTLLNEKNLGVFLKRLFEKSILEYQSINFDDTIAFRNILETFKFDYYRYFVSYDISESKMYTRVELLGILLYRTARYYYKINLEDVANTYSTLGRLISGFEIYYTADIGKGLKINHGLGTVIGARCLLGDNILIHQNVTIGDKGGYRPSLGDNIIIYAGAILLGNIKIQNNAIIGANTVCFIDVPEGSTVVGNPAKVIKN